MTIKDIPLIEFEWYYTKWKHPSIESLDKFNTLKQDIEKNGLKVPISVGKREDGMYIILDGLHRFLVCKELQYTTIKSRMFIQFKSDKDYSAWRVE
jgi:hypothetical protein